MQKYMIATLGGHSALEICLGAKKEKLQSVVIAAKGREKTYTHYFSDLIDQIILVDNFKELTGKKVIDLLKHLNAIFIPHRYCQVYCDISKLETEFKVPVFGNKYLLKYEEREGKSNQYMLMDEGGIEYPKRIANPKNIDRLVLIKVKEKERNYERAFFFASSYSEYIKKSDDLISQSKIKKVDLQNAVIEEFIIGAQVNFNFFYSPLSSKLELLGTDTRRQTNIDGLLRIPAVEQLEIQDKVGASYIESGHISVTVKESLLEKAFEIAEKLLSAARKISSPGIIGPFALQTAILPGPPKEKIIVFDISLRIPGSPGTAFTPYSLYLYGRPVSFGERIAMEIGKANKLNNISQITT